MAAAWTLRGMVVRHELHQQCSKRSEGGGSSFLYYSTRAHAPGMLLGLNSKKKDLAADLKIIHGWACA